MSKIKRIFCGLVFLMVVLSGSPSAKAEFEVLPESRHLLHQTYGLFIDEQSMLLVRDGGRSWGALGGSLALIGNEEWQYHPQLIVHASANAAFAFNSRGDTLLTQTIDARAGLAIDLEFTDELRGSIIWTHQSGHVADNVPDLDLFGSNLGNENIEFRIIRDFSERYRVGAGFRPTVGSDPGMVVLGALAFAEFFPLGQALSPHQFVPYLAAGFEEYGRGQLKLSSHVQIGVAAGGHFTRTKHESLRAVLGYYYGNDPRLKYYQFKYSRLGFSYAGLEFDL